MENVFSDPGFMPHIHCYLDRTSLVWTMMLTDLLIGLAYVAISLTLLALIRKIKLPFSLVVVCFGFFIGACGATHFMEVWTLWHPDYWWAAFLKIITAIASVGTGIYLFQLRQPLVAVAEAAKLSEQRRLDLERLTGDLEVQVKERTDRWESLEARFQKVSKATDLGVWYCDLPFDDLIWNDKTKEHFWMLPNQNVKIADFYNHIHADDRARTRAAIAHSIDAHTNYDIEYRTIRPENPNVWKVIRAIGWTDYDDTGKPIRFDGITLDLTDAKKREEDQLRTELEFKELLERTSDGFATFGPDWRLTYANPVTRSFFALVNRGEIIGQTMEQLFPSPDRTKFTDHYKRIAESGKSEQFEETYEGRVLQVHAYKRREGGVAIFYREVTDERESQRKIEESERRYRTLTETLPQLVWTCRPDGQCDYLSQQWIDYTGVSLQDQLGMDWLSRVIHPDDQARTLEHWMGAVKGLNTYDIEYRIRRNDGVYRWFKARATPVKNKQNEIAHWFGTCTDVQDQREIRQQLEDSVRARDEFLSIASHELKTPLTSLKLQTQLVQRSIQKGDPSVYTKPKVDYLTEQTDKQIGRLARLVDDMLDIARIRAGRLTLERSQVDLVELVKGCIERMEPQFLSGKLSPPLLTISNGPCIGNWDAVRIEQVMNNLFTNAIRYGEGTPVSVTVSHEAGIARVTVKDGGIGIALEAQDKIFDRFERAVDANEVSGLGLGLFITRQIVDAHNGKVSVKSTLGEGAMFTVELPIHSVIEEDLKNGT
jgi:PAS domain S-box-containing protein